MQWMTTIRWSNKSDFYYNFSCSQQTIEMANIMANLKTFQPEYGIGTNEPLFRLRSCAKGLMVNACAHALFFCKLLNATKQKEGNCGDVPAGSQASKDNQTLKIGIIGGGHLGKQLARTLLHLGAISGKNIQISTRRPETLLEFHKLGVECIYNNKQLISWADVAFLCCLPCHLPHICSEIHDSLKNSCIIYSLVTAIPLNRLKQLMSSCSILRPQYKCSENSSFSIWEANRTVLEALKDTTVMQATCPCNSKSRLTFASLFPLFFYNYLCPVQKISVSDNATCYGHY
uniref:NADP-dependent oxidoreductase domain-containing protein 1 n=1 Tax=Laticauda laticaudata TaxID=8630 RepID=A0A8C5SPZ3_LATLA